MKLTKIVIFTLFAGFFLVSCKSGLEKKGDEYLEAGKFKNAVALYTKAQKKGKTSEEFNDNFSTAYLEMMMQLAKKDPQSTVMLGYIQKVPELLENSTNSEVIKSYVVKSATVAKGWMLSEDDALVLEGATVLKTAQEWSKKAGASELKAIEKEIEDNYVKYVIGLADGADNSVAAEYQLLFGEYIFPENEKIQEKLNTIRKKNRGDFLIFQAAGIAKPSSKVDVMSYIIAFPSLKISKTGMSGEFQIWNSAGNNTVFDIEKLKLISTDGKETTAKMTSSGTCTSPELDKKFEPKQEKFTGGKNRLITEGQCALSVSFSFGSDFTPSHVEFKDQYGKGIKYLGH